MSGKKGIIALIILISTAYLTGWYSVYQKSKHYYDFAEQQYQQGHYILALKGMNKIELYPEDNYSGGYQQIIDAWRNGLFVFYPDFYYQAVERSHDLLPKASNEELIEFIQTYTEIDTRYVPDAATCLISRYRQSDDAENEHKMVTFLDEAFPAYQWQSSPLFTHGCQTTE